MDTRDVSKPGKKRLSSFELKMGGLRQAMQLDEGRDEVEEMVEWVAQTIALNKDICCWQSWESVTEEAKEVFRKLAKQILFRTDKDGRPMLAVILKAGFQRVRRKL